MSNTVTRIRLAVVDTEFTSHEINTPEDLAHVRQLMLTSTHG